MGQPELSIGPFCLTRSNPTHQLTDPTKHNPQQVEKFGHNPTRTNTTNKGAYSLAVTYIYTLNLFELLVNQASTYLCSLLVLTHILVLLLQWTRPNPTHKNRKNLDPNRPNQTHGSTQPMDNSGQRTQTERGGLVFRVGRASVCRNPAQRNPDYFCSKIYHGRDEKRQSIDR